jgi:hypothetical protein
MRRFSVEVDEKVPGALMNNRTEKLEALLKFSHDLANPLLSIQFVILSLIVYCGSTREHPLIFI